MVKTIPIFDLAAQYRSLKVPIDKAIKEVIATTSFINGQANRRFDQAFAAYCQTKYSIGVSSGSAALELALEALGVSHGDEVICPAHTFAATAEAIVHRGAKPVFVDIDEATYIIDVSALERAITKKTKAVVVVHMYGQAAPMDAIRRVAKKHHLWVVEDAAQAHGARYKGKRVGSWGDIACFSFFPAKNLGCYGDGGGVVTNSARLAKQVSYLKDHGRVSKYEHKLIGYGERLDNLQAAILLAKLPYLNKWNQRRRVIADYYSRHLAKQYHIPVIHNNGESVYYVYTLRHKKRDAIRSFLEKQGIGTGIYYPLPLHLQESFAFLGYQKGDLPVSERVAKEIFSVPIYPELTQNQVKKIVQALLLASSHV